MRLYRRKLIWVAIAIIALVCTYLILVLGYWFYGKEKLYPGVSIAGISVSNMSDEEVSNLLTKETDVFLGSKITMSGHELNSEKLGLSIDIESTIENAKNKTQENPFLLGFDKDYKLFFSYNKEYLYNFLYSLEKEYKESPKNASVSLKSDSLVVLDGKNGQQINYSETVSSFNKAISNLNSSANISLISIPTSYTKDDLSIKKEEIEELFSDDFALTHSGGNIVVPLSEMVTWVHLNSKKSSDCEIFGGLDFIEPIYNRKSEDSSILSEKYIENYLGNLSEELNTQPVNAQLEMSGGKVSVFIDSKNGKELNISESAKTIKESLDSGKSQAELSFKSIKPDVHLGSLNELGIKELVASGYSNFAGSPSNRRHNIRVGANRFNGLLIKPGETFSFTSNLGEVDSENGYLPELVIKNNETIPEYGGGLCQVSSTAFRAALNAGLPIVARKAHSYPVSYYKPYGTDATIYVPNPDLKFKNDTRGHILIQTRIVGNYLYFDFYGTKNDISVKFAGNKNASGATGKVESVTPYTYDHGGRGAGSFKAIVYRFIYNSKNKLIDSEYYYSNYDSPDKYPH